MDYELIRSSRKTICAEVRGGRLIIRAPYLVPERAIRAYIRQNKDRIEAALARSREKEARKSTVEKLTPEELRELTEQARRTIPERVAHYAPLIGVSYGRIAIRHQRTRWGSCSGKKNLNFNCLLMLAPPEVLDSVVVHELCHLKEMNHSAAFYREVLRVFPEYGKWHGWLRENGDLLLARLA